MNSDLLAKHKYLKYKHKYLNERNAIKASNQNGGFCSLFNICSGESTENTPIETKAIEQPKKPTQQKLNEYQNMLTEYKNIVNGLEQNATLTPMHELRIKNINTHIKDIEHTIAFLEGIVVSHAET